MADIHWYGHSAFKVSSDDVTILIDPFLEGNPSCTTAWQDTGPVDVVLLTHDHGDHVGQAVEICQATGAMLVCGVGTAQAMLEAGVPQNQICNSIGLGLGGAADVKGVRVTLVPAFHTSESGTPVGFIVTLPDGFTFYHAGDTCLYGDMALWGNLYPLDLAMLPIGDVFTMNPQQAAVACTLLRPTHVIPMHWGTFPVLVQDTEGFKEELRKAGSRAACVDMKAGDTVSLKK